MTGYDWMHGYGWGGLGWAGWILNLVVTLAMIVAIVLLVIWLVRQASFGSSGLAGTSTPSRAQPAARETLQARYARGEITRAEYQQMLSDIG